MDAKLKATATQIRKVDLGQVRFCVLVDSLKLVVDWYYHLGLASLAVVRFRSFPT